MKKYMWHKKLKRAVATKKIPLSKFLSLQLDAKRIMGVAPAKNSTLYLISPTKNSDTWKYAQNILKLEWPAVIKIWIGYWALTNLNELSEL